ncbi:MAG TPA: ABC transporter ATP-binding protein [Acidimicrobiales bacterium]|nr:ABC transporter ATP-binding protein [Acidimicrobiales bacterium]
MSAPVPATADAADTGAADTGARPAAPARPAAGDAVVKVHGLDHAFDGPDGQPAPVLRGIDLDVADGEFLAVVGPSGCGKTTLLNLISGLEARQGGTVEVRGAPPRVGNRDVGYLFARDALLPWRTVLENAELAMEVGGRNRAERRAVATRLLDQVGLGSHLHSYPAQLSQGMRQRVAIARTLAPRPGLLMLDEPFSALDAQTKILLQDAFAALWAELGSTVVLITHDLSEAIGLADRVVVMTARPGRIKRVFDIDLPRPRSLVNLQSDPHYHRIYQQVWDELREEVLAR